MSSLSRVGRRATGLTRDVGTMFTKVFHPNISKSGEICVDTLKKGWKKEYGVGHVLVVSRIGLVIEILRLRYRYRVGGMVVVSTKLTGCDPFTFRPSNAS